MYNTNKEGTIKMKPMTRNYFASRFSIHILQIQSHCASQSASADSEPEQQLLECLKKRSDEGENARGEEQREASEQRESRSVPSPPSNSTSDAQSLSVTLLRSQLLPTLSFHPSNCQSEDTTEASQNKAWWPISAQF
ncbi:hypothetical protein BLNAU_12170 [Blattamonas nauphoetae]|uniref:Uncharacterized protein n=1 Tax=Blattamonas nauphoetae TaxID=2049346 RepID=A0ABQ9XM73_9EUKA|nr:hypothetical protein BLNAU_12170 [Blattamonas nauphoetae]